MSRLRRSRLRPKASNPGSCERGGSRQTTPLALPFSPPAGGRLGRGLPAGVTQLNEGAAVPVMGSAAPITLDYVKKHLNITSSTDDAELQDVLDAAVSLAEDLIGPITPRQITETQYVDGGSSLVLKAAPVMSVESVNVSGVPYTAGAGYFNFTVTPAGTLNLFPLWSGGIDPAYGFQIEVGPVYRSAWRTVQVTYTAGRASLSAREQLGVAEIVRHLWRPQSGSRMSSGGDEYTPSRRQILAEVASLFGTSMRSAGIG